MAKMVKRIIVGILSANGFEERRERCRATWVADLAGYQEAEFAFVVGGGVKTTERCDDVLRVPCPDDYESLPCKTMAMLNWALENFEFEYIFKCDDDTYVSIPRLMHLNLLGREYVGLIAPATPREVRDIF